MKKSTLVKTGLALALTLTLTACGGNAKKDDAKKDGGKDSANHSAALVTDIGGVDDKSFNQSAWEGLQEWGKDNKKEKGKDGFNYYQSTSDADFLPNLNQAINDGFKTIFGIGFKLQPAIEEIAGSKKDNNFVIIDSVVEGKDNVASVVFKDNEAAYLAGIAAAKTTKSKKVGFVGGQEGEVIGRFDAGFVAGVKSVDPEIKVDVQYAGSFGDAAKGKSIAAAMYKSGVDVIFHASGDTGNGVFSEARDIMKSKPAEPVWVIGVDRDQEEEGKYDGGNVTLTSTLKGVGTVVKDIATKANEDKFPGGETLVYGLKDGGVDLTKGQLTDDVQKAVDAAKTEIKDGKVEVPEKPTK
ncbi:MULTISPECIES: BMP family protein [Vagococcus]|uniref:Predicted nucleoside ABC transporter, substrate-binding component n=1 Tax=Vagococcus fluvialis bH819 TaxID=1255619 RepID=A0A1X6WPX8_9ENTE|nr:MULTISPECIES: BMP family protein [Vagococcus]SLM86292.1 Predicted nucleoside ABC transporter, substrate-binding component [Vagococcus fluvialis bH819]HCM88882.1 BMP family ABC transporter substrate-binding protein [Vagococcus sp.]